MADFSGIGDFVAAVTGGRGIEQDAYDAATQRLIQERSGRAQMDKRVLESFMTGRQNDAQEALLQLGVLDPNDPRTQLQSLAAGGFNLNQTGSGLNELLTFADRQRLEQASLGEGQTLSNAIARSLKPQLTENTKVQGGAALTNLYGDTAGINPEVQAVINAQKASSSAAGGKPGAKDAEIQAYMNLGFSYEDSVKQAYDKKRLEIDQLGQARSLDELTGAVSSVPITGPTSGQSMPTAPAGQTLSEQVQRISGPVSAAVSAAATAAAIGGVPFEEEFTKARQQAKIVTQMALEAFTGDDKIALQEKAWAREALGTLPKFIDDPIQYEKRLQALWDSMNRRIGLYTHQLGSPDRYSPDYLEGINNARAYLEVLKSEIGNPYASNVAIELQSNPEWRELTPDEQTRLFNAEMRERGYLQ